MIGVEVRGLRAAHAMPAELSKGIRKTSAETNFRKAVALQRTWQAWVRGPRSRSRIHSHGRYVKGIRAYKDGEAGVTGNPVEYARIHELGGKTKPHVIRPRRAKMLAFQVGGSTVFASKVNHPGSRMPARPSMGPALKLAMPAIEKLDEGQWDEARQLAEDATRDLARRYEKLSAFTARAGSGLRELRI